MKPADIAEALDAMRQITPDLPYGVAVVTTTGHEITGKVTLMDRLLRLDSLCTCGKTHQPVFIACERIALMRGVEEDRAARNDEARDAVKELMRRLKGEDDEGGDHTTDLKRFN